MRRFQVVVPAANGRARVVGVESEEAVDAPLDLAEVRAKVAVGVVEEVIGVAVRRRGRTVHHVAAHLVDVAVGRGAQKGLLVGAQRVRESDAGGDRVPLEIFRRAVGDRREEVGENRVGRRDAALDAADLAVPAQTDLEGQVAEEHRVAHVEVGRLDVVREVREPVDLDRVVPRTGAAVERGVGVEEDQLIARPRKQRADVRVAVADAELQLVRERAGVEEGRAVEAHLILRTLGVVVVVAVVREAVSVIAEVPGGRKAAQTAVDVVAALAVVGDELETTLDLRIETGQVEVRAEHVRVLDLPHGRTFVAVVLVPARFLRTRRTDVAADLDLVADHADHAEAVRRERLRIQLPVERLEGRLVGEVDRSGRLEQVDLLLAVGSPEPQAVADDRSAGFDAHVIDVVDLVDDGEIARRLARDRRIRLPGVLGREVAGRPGEVVRAALGDHVHLHARGLDARVGATRRDLHLLERVEVVVGRRGAERADVGDVDAVDVPRRLVGRGTLAGEVRLLAGLVATDVDAVDEHAGRLLEDDPRVAAAGNGLELDLGHGRTRAGPADVEQRSLGRDRDRLSHRRVQGQRHVGAGAETDVEPRARRRAVTGQLSLEGVRTGGEVGEAEATLRVRYCGLGSTNTRERHRDTRKGSSIVADDIAEQRTRLNLRECADGHQRNEQGGECRAIPNGRAPFHTVSFPVLGNERTFCAGSRPRVPGPDNSLNAMNLT